MNLLVFSPDSNLKINEIILQSVQVDGDPLRMPHDERLISAKAEFFVAQTTFNKSKVALEPNFSGVLDYGTVSSLPAMIVSSCSRETLNKFHHLRWNSATGTGLTCLVYVSNWMSPAGSIMKTGKSDAMQGFREIPRQIKFSDLQDPVEYFGLTSAIN